MAQDRTTVVPPRARQFPGRDRAYSSPTAFAVCHAYHTTQHAQQMEEADRPSSRRLLATHREVAEGLFSRGHTLHRWVNHSEKDSEVASSLDRRYTDADSDVCPQARSTVADASSGAESNGKPAAQPLDALSRDSAAVGLNDLPRDCQTQACSPAATAGWFHLVETLKDAL